MRAFWEINTRGVSAAGWKTGDVGQALLTLPGAPGWTTCFELCIGVANVLPTTHAKGSKRVNVAYKGGCTQGMHGGGGKEGRGAWTNRALWYRCKAYTVLSFSIQKQTTTNALWHERTFEGNCIARQPLGSVVTVKGYFLSLIIHTATGNKLGFIWNVVCRLKGLQTMSKL